MLSGYQVEVVGFDTEDGAICWDCARDQYGSLVVEKQRMGLTTSVSRDELSPIIRYTAQEAATGAGYHCGCADELEDDPPKAEDAPEDWTGPVDEGYYGSPELDADGNTFLPWRSNIYHESCATFPCDNCGEDLAS